MVRGIRLGGSNIQVLGNYIGTDATGTSDLGNRSAGIVLDGPSSTTIGGDPATEGNLIAGNDSFGLRIQFASDVSVLGNRIGTDPSGSLAIGNANDGINVVDSSNINLGTSLVPGQNSIAFNGGGISVEGQSTSGVQILGNSIQQNFSVGIDLNRNGVTANDAGDADSGPNGLQNFPVLSVDTSGASPRFLGTLNSVANETFNIEVFLNDVSVAGDAEGETLFFATSISTDGNGDASFTIPSPTSGTTGFFTATATDSSGNTSEFSEPLDSVVASISVEKSTNGQDADVSPGPSIVVGDTATFTYTVTNPGNIELSGIAITDDNGTPADSSDDFSPSFISGDTDGDLRLDPGETWIYEATRTVTAGQYTNTGTVDAVPVDSGGVSVGAPVISSDPSNHFGASPAIEIQKATNGQDADTSPGVFIAVGDTATFTYQVTNTGNAEFDAISVIDDNGTPADSSDDFLATFVSGDTDLNGFLSPGETWAYDAPSNVRTVTTGQYTNSATVTANPVDSGGIDIAGLADQTASDSSNHFGFGAQISVEKSTNGQDADVSPGPSIVVGDTATFTYTVTNPGNIELSGIAITDDNGTPADSSDDFSPSFISGDTDSDLRLDPGETWIYEATRTVTAGQYTNTGTVDALPVDSGGVSVGASVSASDPSNHFGVDAIVTVDDSISTDEDLSVSLNVLSNDTNNAGGSLVASTNTPPASGFVTIDPAGDVVYTPNPDFFGSDSFTYLASANGQSSVGTVNVTVLPVNDPPVIGDLSLSLDLGSESSLTFTESQLLASSSPGPANEMESLILSSVDSSSSQGGVISDLGGGDFTYTPPTAFSGTDTFTYTLEDTNQFPLSATGTISINVSSSAVVANADSVSTDEDTPVSIDVLANDTGSITLSIITFDSTAALGSISQDAGGLLTYTPFADEFGTDSFTYTVSDGITSDSTSVTVTILPVNDPPVFVSDPSFTTPEESISINGNATLNDSAGPANENDTVTISSVASSSSAGGTATLNGGVITYTPPQGFVGTDTLSYVISDEGGLTDNGTAIIEVVSPSGFSIGSGTPFQTGSFVGFVTEGDIDNDGDTDLIVANEYQDSSDRLSSLSVMANDGSGNFTEVHVPFPSGIERPQSVFVANLNGDSSGDLDIAVAISGSTPDQGEILVSTNIAETIRQALSQSSSSSSSPLMANPSWSFAGAGLGPSAIDGRDLDNDGDIDLAYTNFYGNTLSILLNNGAGGFSPFQTLPTGVRPADLVIGDVEDNGAWDIAVANHGSNSVDVFLGFGDGGFSLGGTLTGITKPSGLAVGNFDGLGFNDLAVAAAAEVQIYYNDGDFSDLDISPEVIPFNSLLRGIESADFDGDGDDDLLVANAGSETINYLENFGSMFSTVQNVSVPHVVQGAPAAIKSLAVGDFNGDGRFDVAGAHFLHGITVHSGSSSSSSVSNPSVSGSFFSDSNGNGVRDAGEFGISGASVYADLNENSQADPNEPITSTDSDGGYTLTLPNAGTYSIVGSPSFGQTTVTVSAGEALSGVDIADVGSVSAVDDNFVVDSNSGSALLDVLANDIFSPLDSVQIISVDTLNTSGSVSISNSSILYIPAPGALSDSFGYNDSIVIGHYGFCIRRGFHLFRWRHFSACVRRVYEYGQSVRCE